MMPCIAQEIVQASQLPQPLELSLIGREGLKEANLQCLRRPCAC